MAVGACLLQNAVKVKSVLFNHRNNAVFSLIGEQQKKYKMVKKGKMTTSNNKNQKPQKTNNMQTVNEFLFEM